MRSVHRPVVLLRRCWADSPNKSVLIVETCSVPLQGKEGVPPALRNRPLQIKVDCAALRAEERSPRLVESVFKSAVRVHAQVLPA